MNTRAVVCAVVCGFASAAQADILNLEAILDGLQETPPVATPGSGVATMTLDTTALTLVMNGSFSNLIGTTNNAHIHGPAPIGTPAGVLINITFDFGVTSGTFSYNGPVTAAQAQHIIDGNTYINIHSTFRPGGEIRGQIVPAPSALAALGLGGLFAARRRRR